MPSSGLIPSDAVQAYTLDMGKMPTAEQQPGGVNTTTHGTGRAMMVVSPEIVPPSTADAAIFAGSGFAPGEAVNVFLNGTLVTAFAADANGVVVVYLNSGAGPGAVILEFVGGTSGRRAAGVTQISNNGPFVRPFVAVPHAVTTGAGGTFIYYGARFPTATTLPVTRNGVLLGNVTAGADGRTSFTYSPANSGNTAAVYTIAVAGQAGSLVGISVEERSDAGVLPNADSNIARGFTDRAVINSTSGGRVTWQGEGFIPNETVNVTGCVNGSGPASGNGTIIGFFDFVANNPGSLVCTMTGATSGRVARTAAFSDPNATTSRSLMVAPSLSFSSVATPVNVIGSNMTPGTGTAALDGVVQGNVTAGADGVVTYQQAKPAPGLHYVTFVDSAGRETSAVFYVTAATAANVSVSGRVVNAYGTGVRGARVTFTDSRGNVLSGFTNSFGYYAINDVPPGDTYMVNAASKGLTFVPRAVTVTDTLTGVDITAQ
jgi:hypothetical protein